MNSVAASAPRHGAARLKSALSLLALAPQGPSITRSIHWPALTSPSHASPFPMPRYTEYRDFPDIHSDTITHVAFNPDGKLLASASLDGTLCISNIKSSLLCHQYFGGHAILSVVWADNERIICSLKDGTIACLVINSETVRQAFPPVLL